MLWAKNLVHAPYATRKDCIWSWTCLCFSRSRTAITQVTSLADHTYSNSPSGCMWKLHNAACCSAMQVRRAGNLGPGRGRPGVTLHCSTGVPTPTGPAAWRAAPALRGRPSPRLWRQLCPMPWHSNFFVDVDPCWYAAMPSHQQQ